MKVVLILVFTAEGVKDTVSVCACVWGGAPSPPASALPPIDPVSLQHSDVFLL